MARGGVNKAVVQIARTAILARGEHPSIDAVRIEMGNTGSKTTIHRYLKELEEIDSRRGAPQEQLGDELAEVSQQVLLGKTMPQAAADRLELGLKGWYAPHQGNQEKGGECQCNAAAPVTAPASAALATLPAVAGSAASSASATVGSSSAAPPPAAEVEQALASELDGAQP